MSEKKPNEGILGGGKQKGKKNHPQNQGFFGSKSKDLASRNIMRPQRGKGHSKGR
ncbi:MAG TPA: hypothetical protein VLG76_02530 [Rhabdochlamydiaceae bacterium]|nr:hypothetical protein [Rhabdochlamydiaceae bacterium]